jgi:superfamily II DNA or RNA helicase
MRRDHPDSLLGGNDIRNTAFQPIDQENVPRPLRDYQVGSVRQTYEQIRFGKRRVVLQLPTGAGKTRLAAEIIKHALSRSKRVAFVVPYLGLVDQTCAAFGSDGLLDIGVVQAAHPLWWPDAPVQICSAQTLERRDFRPDVDVVIIDECHRRNSHVQKWLADGDETFIGLSATPWAKGMALHWDSLVRPISMSDLIDQGHLVPFRVFAPSKPDLSGVRSRRGVDGELDYVEGDLSGAVCDPVLVADVVSTWCARAEGRSTVVFAVDCGHAHVLRAEFEKAGVSVGYIDAKTPRIDRAELVKRLESGDIKVIVNIDVLTAGFDCPTVSCIVMARPTRSEIRYVQAIGRGLRPAPGKTDCLILDHSDTTERLGFVTNIAYDNLDDGTERGKSAASEKVEALPKKCPACSYLNPPMISTCPACGFMPEVRRVIECVDGDLVEVTSAVNNRGVVKFSWLSDDELLGQLKYYADEREYKPGWATAKFKVLRNRWPPRHIAPGLMQPPASELRGWIRSEAIRFAKSNGRRARA